MHESVKDEPAVFIVLNVEMSRWVLFWIGGKTRIFLGKGPLLPVRRTLTSCAEKFILAGYAIIAPFTAQFTTELIPF